MFGCERMPEAGVCYLLGAGPLYGYTVAKRPQDLLIAADGGLLHAQQMGVAPDLLLGDFDSLGSVPDVPGCMVLPREKDDTDMLAAAKEGLRRGYRNFVLLGGTGGRVDHTLANLQLLAFLKEAGAAGWLAGECNVTTLLKGETRTYDPACSGYISIFAFGGEAVVTLSGLKYPLQPRTLTLSPTFPLGVSNEFVGVSAKIQVEQGSVLVVYERKK